MEKTTKTRIMLINWKWEHYKDEQIINDKRLEGESLNHSIATFTKFVKRYAAESKFAEEAYIYTTRIFKGNLTETLLLHLINYIHHQFKGKEVELFLFLHRGEHYVNADVRGILDKTGGTVKKCFLFAEGRDFIYFCAKQERGILNDIGGFQDNDCRINEKEEAYHSVLSEDKTIVLSPYFDDVWHHYKHEFKQKIAELEEAFFDACAHFTFPNEKEEFHATDLVACLKQQTDNALYYRLKSFLGEYDKEIKISSAQCLTKGGVLEGEVAKIEDLEKKHKTSYVFDDCNANLKSIIPNNPTDKKSHDIYSEIVQKMKPIILEPDGKKMTKSELRQWRDLFNDLIATFLDDAF